jgi:hypothetical protein
VNEIEATDIAAVVIIGKVAAQKSTHMRLIDEKLLLTEKRIIGNQTLQRHYCPPLVVELTVETVSETEIARWISINLTVAGERSL